MKVRRKMEKINESEDSMKTTVVLKEKKIKRIKKMFKIMENFQAGGLAVVCFGIVYAIFATTKNATPLLHLGSCIMWIIYSVSYSLVASELKSRVCEEEFFVEIMKNISETEDKIKKLEEKE